jgi:putative ABC transport system permease protein
MAKGTIGERVYRQLLRLYPRDFSDDYADEMTHLYRDRVRGEGATSVWLALVADLARTTPREQISTLVQDVRHAWRTWRRTPVLALAAVLTLALGVGANTAVFSVVHGVLLRPLPYPDAHRLVEVFEDNTRAGGGPFFRVSLPNYLSWIERAQSFDALAAFNGRDFTVTEHGDPERILGSAITASLFKVLGVAPIVGRPLSAEDEQPGAAPVAVLAESLWVRGFGGDRSVVGRSIVLNGTPHRIVGVVPAVFRELGRTQIGSAGAAQIFVPLTMDTAQSRCNHTLRVVARLRPKTSLDQSRDEMHRVAANMEQEFPSTNRNWGVRIERLNDSMFDPRVRVSLLVLLGAVGVVLLIACANVANLVLAAATSRQRELALRAALGARPARLARQLLTESVSLAMVSGACGLTVALVSMQALRTMIPPTVPRIDEIRLDGTVLVFGLFITIACGLFFGMAPAARGARTNLLPALTQSGRGVLGSSREFWRHGLVVVQTGFATALVIVAALLMQSLVRLQHVPLGFEPNGVITARLSAPQVKYPTAAATLAFHRTLLGSLESLPSVRAVGLMTSAPFAPGVRRGVPLHARAAGRGSPDTPTAAVEQVVSPALFRALSVKLMAGREFATQDQPGSPLVAIVSEGLARRLWANGDAVGRILEVEGRSHDVVGVVGDIRGSEGTARGGGLDRDPSAVLYLSSAQFPQNTVSLVIRADTHPEAILPAIRAAVREIDAAQPIPGLRPLDEWIAETTEQPRLTTTLASAFAVAALLLTAVGIYGVISHSVSQRTQEIGVRMAIGAARTSVVGLVLRGGMTWAAGGIVLGLLGAWAASRAIAGLLFDTSAADPLTFGVTAFGLAGVAALACMVPAIRATRIDPVIALRGD